MAWMTGGRDARVRGNNIGMRLAHVVSIEKGNSVQTPKSERTPGYPRGKQGARPDPSIKRGPVGV